MQNDSFNDALKNHLNGNISKALKLYKKSLKDGLELPAIYNNIGLIYNSQEKKILAKNNFLKAIELDSDFIEAHTNIAALYNQIGNYKKSIEHSKKILKINSRYAKSYNNLGISYDCLGKQKEAEKNLLKCIELDPNLKEAHNNLGSIYKFKSSYNAAIKFYEKAIEIDKNFYQAKKNLGLVFLLLKNFTKGFELYEHRIQQKNKEEYVIEEIKSVYWQGENLNDKTILILSEQGLGDIIQFSRYIFKLKKDYNVNIIFKTHKKIFHLFKHKELKLISKDDSIPYHDYHVFLMSIPKIYYKFNSKLLSVNHYFPKNNLIYNKWKKKLSSMNYLKVGINWSGSLKKDKDEISIPIKYFANLVKIKKINFISLQKGHGENEIKNFKFNKKIHSFGNNLDLINPFEDSIEIIRQLDLVITSDTSIAHLSGTIGTKTWVVLNSSPDWRWFLNQSTSPWYKNMKLFRQKNKGDWLSVMNEIEDELKKIL